MKNLLNNELLINLYNILLNILLKLLVNMTFRNNNKMKIKINKLIHILK